MLFIKFVRILNNITQAFRKVQLSFFVKQFDFFYYFTFCGMDAGKARNAEKAGKKDPFENQAGKV